MEFDKMDRAELIEHINKLQQELDKKSSGMSRGVYDLTDNLQSSEILKKRFEASKAKNPAFSLRSFAQKVGVSAGRISEVLKGQYLLSMEMAEKIVDKIDFELADRDLFLQAVLEENNNAEQLKEFHRKMSERSNLHSKNEMRHLETEEEVVLLDHWQYYGIMTALQMKGCEHTVAWLAGLMQLEEATIEERLRVMLKLKIVEEKEDKFYLVPKGNFNSGTKESPRASQIAAMSCSSTAFKYMSDRFSQEIYESDEQSSSQNVYFFLKAIDSSKVGKVPEFIAQSAYKSLEEMSESDNVDSIYMVNVSFLKI